MSKSARAQTNFHAGLSAEAIVARAYQRAGAEIAVTRWRGTGGEIDLIARNGARVLFVEVKKSRTHDAARQRLSRRQIERIFASASEFVTNEPNGQLTEMRFDLATVDQNGTVQILENAFSTM